MIDLIKIAKESDIPEVLEAVAEVIMFHASRRPQDEEGDWYVLVNDLKAMAGRAREYEEHFSGRRG